jgi:TetR/AcrR family transcriptional repressor of bet genes
MAKLRAEPLRRAEIVQATIHEIGRRGSLEVTVAQIAQRAGVSSALAHHYFGSKEQIFVATMRHVMTLFGVEARQSLAGARTPRERLKAVIDASFAPDSFRREVVSAWLNFYVLAQTDSDARRLLNVYHRRLNSNLLHDLRPIVGNARAATVAQSLAALIDGLYLRAALTRGAEDFDHALDPAAAVALVMETFGHEIGACDEA